MKANLNRPILTLLASAITCALPLVAGATDQADTDTHYSSNFAPIVERVRQAVLSLPKTELAKYGAILKTPCVSGPDYGAMGVHLINAENVDAVVNVDKPEALIYEPQANGKLRIVGVEYIVPKEAWDAANPAQPGLPSPRPALLGNLMNFVDSPNRYGIEGGFFEIHVWAFEDNRKGALTDWNPAVTCEKQRVSNN
jgi:hypothetical protein